MRLTRLKEPAAFTGFVLLLIVVAIWSTHHQGEALPEDVLLDLRSAPLAMPTQDGRKGDPSQRNMRVVQVFDAGSLPVQASTTVKNSPQEPVAGNTPLLPQQGNWPTIDADYSSIGFEGFLDIVDRLGGRFFLLVRNNLGPEVSLKNGLILGPKVERGLALARPYLVTDKEVQQRLGLLHLPPGADRKSVVLLLSGWFDQLLWREVESAVAEQGHSLGTVSLIKAYYLKASDGTYLALGRMRVRNRPGVVELKKLIRLPL